MHPDVAECAVIGSADTLKGELPLGLVVLKPSAADRDHNDVTRELVELVRERIGAVASFRKAFVVDQLPRTRSGKILRRTLRQLADGALVQIPPTIEDPAVVDRLRDVLAR